MKWIGEKSFQNKLTLRLFLRFCLSVVLFTAVLIIVFLLGIYAGHNLIIWINPFDLMYRVLNVVDNQRYIFFIIVWGIGFLFITLRFFKIAIGYIAEMTNAIDGLFESESDLMKFSGELKDVEDRLNQIKYNNLRNQQLAKEAEQRKNDLVVYLAHDLKTPLTSVIGYLTLLKEEQRISEELREKYLAVSLDKAERLEDLINEFFEITRFNLKDLTLETSKLNLTRMLEQISDEFKPMMKDKNLTCSLKTSEEIIIRADGRKLERVFDNLIRNSISYSFVNSVIEIDVRTEGNDLLMKFRNHGDTIPAHKLEHIFDQFYRLDTARSSETGGAGLGLAIAREIIELHKGTITAASSDELIEFTIRLPIGI